jgi:hypothetical protein
MTTVAVLFFTILGLHGLVVGGRPNCHNGICYRANYLTDENQLIKTSMVQSRSRLLRARDIAIHKQLIYPKNAINHKKKYPIRIKISRNTLKKHFKYPKSKPFQSRNLIVRPRGKIPIPRSFHLKKGRLRRHMRFINR